MSDMEENGHPIEQPPGVTITIRWDDKTGLTLSYPSSEMYCRFMMDKARAEFDEIWRRLNQPHIEIPKMATRPRIGRG